MKRPETKNDADERADERSFVAITFFFCFRYITIKDELGTIIMSKQPADSLSMLKANTAAATVAATSVPFHPANARAREQRRLQTRPVVPRALRERRRRQKKRTQHARARILNTRRRWPQPPPPPPSEDASHAGNQRAHAATTTTRKSESAFAAAAFFCGAQSPSRPHQLACWKKNLQLRKNLLNTKTMSISNVCYCILSDH